MTVEGDPSFWKWVGAGCLAIIAFFMKHLHRKLHDAASKTELAGAMSALAAQRKEDQERAETNRQERRQTEALLFGRLDRQDQAISRIEGKLEVISRNGH